MKKLLLLLFVVVVYTSCDEDTLNNRTATTTTYVKQESSQFKKGKRQLEVMGYTNIKEEGSPVWCCSDDDSWLFSTGFKATDKSGEIVKGCICGAAFKGITIRFK